MIHAKELSKRERRLASEFLSIDKESLSGLSWTGHWYEPTAARISGKRFGAAKEGYWQGMIEGRRIYVHNLVYWLAYGIDAGQYPLLTVDHVDGNGRNNSPANLRLASKKQQAANRKEPCAPCAHLRPNHFIGESGYRWVQPSGNAWRGRFWSKGALVNCGTFSSPLEAYENVLQSRTGLGLPIPHHLH